MHLIFVHGWSVTHTNTYGNLPESLVTAANSNGISLDIAHIHLGKYISFRDEVSMDDIATALNYALSKLPGNSERIQPFSCITHSTGGPVMRYWIDKWVDKVYSSKGIVDLPIQHLIMLAPANHGSSLAALGKKRVGRIKAWFNGIEPGQRILDWLSLGSDGQWQLNESFLRYRSARNGFFPFVLIGQGIDTKFYDFINGYLVEAGSDGVVRVAGANLNFRYLSLHQTSEAVKGRDNVLKLEYNHKKPVRFPQRVPLGIFSQFSHSGTKMGIMAVKESQKIHHQITKEIMKCLSVKDAKGYSKRAQELKTLTYVEQSKKPVGKNAVISRYSMLIFRVRDQKGVPIDYDDIDIHLLAGKSYSADSLPPGFFIDRQLNRKSSTLVYYLDADKMSSIKDGLFGVKVIVRPNEGFSYFVNGEFHSDGIKIDKVCAANETTYIDIMVNRHVDKNVFCFSPADEPRKSFKDTKPLGDGIEN